MAGAIWYRRHRRYDTTTTMPDPCSESVPPPGGEGVLRRLRRPAVGNTWAGWGSMPVIFFAGMAGHPCPTLRATSLSLSKENRQISERDDLGPPVVPGGQEIGLGSRNLRPRAEVHVRVPARRATWPNGEWGYSTRRHMHGPRGGVTRQGVILMNLQSLLDCQ